ncbi:MAG: hydantoinase B/oxoprolinase family protein [Dehalococcoidia bacterium]|nr:hydantoinase B/oxoprolinase family protein [Dehalococcoidia bacterium]
MRAGAGGGDSITVEVVRNRLESIVREMGEVILRTSRSSVAHHGRDFSCGIFDARAEMLALGTSIAIHIFPVGFQLRALLARFGDDILTGDIFVGNDPRDGGLHPNDVLLAVPVFYDGQMVAFSTTRVHHYDVGGMVPGSISGNATEMYQEGLRIPIIRMGRGNEIDPNIMDLILNNVRVPVEMRGDLLAQLAGCRVGAQRITSMVERYGKERVRSIWSGVLDSYERRCRALISRLPNRTLVHEGYLDSDGVAPGHLRIRTVVRIEDGGVTVDYTGSSPQTGGPNNVTLPMGASYGFMGVKAALDPSGPINSGYLRPIETIVPEGTILNARPPAAAGGQQEVGQAAISAMVALAEVVPERVSSEEGSSTHHMTCSGTDTRFGRPRPFIFYGSDPGGGGARADRDGMDYVRPIRSGNTNARGIEVLERAYPLTFLGMSLRCDSGGPGRFRGGLGTVREYRIPSDGTFSLMGEHAMIPPAGVFGGYPGALARFEVLRSGETVPVSPVHGSKATAFPLKAGDVLRVCSQGAGGWGDPLEREPDSVLDDVLDGRVSRAQAAGVYGVVLDAPGETVDTTATIRKRRDLASARLYLRAARGGDPEFHGGVRIAWVGSAVARRIGAPPIGPHRLAEAFAGPFSNKLKPAPFRFSVALRGHLAEDAIELDREAWEDLGLSEGDSLLVRSLWSPDC